MDFERVAIIGTNCISVSIALGLQAQPSPPEVVGHDPDPLAADLAREQGAFDRVERRPGRACEGADLVIVAVPLGAVREAFAAIAPHLQPGCIVTDTARLKAPPIHWAKELLPQSVSFVGGHPIPNPTVVGLEPLKHLDTASADLLKGTLYCFTTPTRASGATIDACSTLAQALGAYPFFIDVTEHDGLQAGVEELLDLLAVALLRATVDTPGWQEMRKFAGNRFATATQVAEDACERRTAVFLNRENVLHRLDGLLSELVHLRDLLTREDADGLEEAFASAAESRAAWIEDRRRGMWGDAGAIDTHRIPTAGEQMGRLFFGKLGSRLRGKPDRSPKE